MSRNVLALSAVVASCGFAGAALAVTPEHEALRAELRAFYPDECHSPCKLAAQTNSVQAIARGIDAYVAAHPEADALDIRCENYRIMDGLDLLKRAGIETILVETDNDCNK